MQITRNSLKTNSGPSDWFTGTVYIDPIAAPSPPSRTGAASVHFTPGARTAWHTHPFGQTIYVTEGIGRCQREGEPVEEIRPGRPGLLRARRDPLARRRGSSGDHPQRRDRRRARVVARARPPPRAGGCPARRQTQDEAPASPARAVAILRRHLPCNAARGDAVAAAVDSSFSAGQTTSLTLAFRSGSQVGSIRVRALGVGGVSRAALARLLLVLLEEASRRRFRNGGWEAWMLVHAALEEPPVGGSRARWRRAPSAPSRRCAYAWVSLPWALRGGAHGSGWPKSGSKGTRSGWQTVPRGGSVRSTR